MAYKIKYSYKTGDSFHSHDVEDILDYEWENLDIAKEALKRIREHYKWYEYMEGARYEDKVEKPKWFNVKSDGVDEDLIHHLINLPMDNWQEVQFWPPWCGYFEKLNGAEIVLDSIDMSFVTH